MVVLAAILVAHLIGRPFRGISLYFIAAAAGFAIMRVWSSGAGQVLLRSAGNDPLAYESQAYSILISASLRAGESVFGWVPAYRYIKFLEHAAFGDGNMLYAAVLLAAYFGGVFSLFRGAGSCELTKVQKALLSGLGFGLIFLGGYYVSQTLRDGLSEYGTWILLLWALPILFEAAHSRKIMIGVLAMAFSFTLRPNQLPGILWILLWTAVGSWKKESKAILLAGILGLGISLLPLAHNLTFGHQWVLTTTSGGASVNLAVPPATWLAFFQGDPAAVETVRAQLGMLFLITDVPRSMIPTLAAMGILCLAWLGTIGYGLPRRKLLSWMWMATPLIFLSLHLVFVVNNYYPRHIVIGYLSMGVVAVLVLIREARTACALAGAAVELPRN
jgi:hypothetical protein